MPARERAVLLIVLGLLGVLARAAFAQSPDPVHDGSTHARRAGSRVEVGAPSAGGRPAHHSAATPSSDRATGGGVAVLLAQSAWLEATWNACDAAAIAHLLVKRAKRAHVPLASMVMAYSLDKRTERAAVARALPAGLQGADVERWSALVKLTAGVLRGKVKNPAPGASHFGSPHPQLADHLRAERMIAQGQWYAIPVPGCANRFYGELPWAPKQPERVIAAREAGGRR